MKTTHLKLSYSLLLETLIDDYTLYKFSIKIHCVILAIKTLPHLSMVNPHAKHHCCVDYIHWKKRKQESIKRIVPATFTDKNELIRELFPGAWPSMIIEDLTSILARSLHQSLAKSQNFEDPFRSLRIFETFSMAFNEILKSHHNNLWRSLIDFHQDL